MVSIFGPFSLTAFIKSSHSLAMPSTLALHCPMLADTPSPRGSGALPKKAGYFVGGQLSSTAKAPPQPRPGYYRWDSRSSPAFIQGRQDNHSSDFMSHHRL
ncbi:MAG: hypothetical protein M3Y56_12310 [Armatimonadota bacterium]|nr:hypothetical protein [Armatimonadota bacterium]